MSFQSQPLPNGLPSATQLDAFNRFQPPSTTGQYQPPMTQQMLHTKLPAPPQQQLQNQTQQFNSHYQQQVPQNRQQQQLLANGGSNTSSRTASPALNQSINSAHLPPTQGSTQSLGPLQASSQNQSLFPSRQPGSLHGSTQNLAGQNSINPIVANLTTNMKNISITNGQPPSSNATNHNVPSLVNGNQQQNQQPRMPPKTDFNSQANGSQFQPAMAPPSTQNPQISGAQYQQQHSNGQMPPPLQQNQPQYPAMPQFNNHLPANVTTPALNNIQSPPQPPFNQSHFPNQIKPLGPQTNQSQYQNQFHNNNQPNACAPNLLPPTAAAPPTLAAFNKRPMYPAQVSTQPSPQQQQQQQQNYQQPQITQNTYPAQQSQLFTGQPNNAPIQYQNNKQLNYPSNPMGVTQQGFNKMWGHETVDLMQQRHILPTNKIVAPAIELGHEFYESVNCSSE